MKKIFALVMVVAMLATMALGIAADELVESPEKKPSDVVSGTKDDGADVTGNLLVFDYDEKDQLSADKKADFEKSFEVITGVDDLSKLDPKVRAIAERNKVNVEDLTVSDVFYIDSNDENVIKDGDTYTVTLKADNLDKFAGLMSYNDGKWSVLDGAYVNADGYLVFKTNSLGPYAILSTKTTVSAPQTGDAMIVVSAVALVAVAAFMAVVVIRKRENA